MSAHDSERKRARPPVSSRGIEALLERWVSDLEREDPWSETRSGTPGPPNRASPEQPLPPLEEEPAPPRLKVPEQPELEPSEVPQAAPSRAVPPREPRTRAAPAREPERGKAASAARAEIRVHGPLVTFPWDDVQVVLGRKQERLLHRGTVAVRGPCAPSREEMVRLGLTGAQALALEFVLAWFGSPFDAVDGDHPGGDGPSWGAWPLSGEALVRALARWKRRDPTSFEASLGRLGIDAVEEGQEPPALSVLDTEGQPVGGHEALALLSDDVRLFAALARAGRERSAQLAQLECIIEHSLHPALTQAERGTESPAPAGELFPTPRALALLLHAELRLGRRGATRFAALAREEAGKTGGVERAGHRFASSLQSAGRSREASEVRRLLSSPELAVTPVP
ncbi:hypothetical protein [Vitiosangium sp. GDMCC 1.1324]|uniref:hypothetical protein n=1 Tax=Vitiosangium sp. (strain GDMCC 1.1324) TaxID=2138576 RepID=UPI000D35E348|nr:hypothetical protein [Vitiosangium sp. GDMCC 1.1324]PTL81219.1 hypothetical protein DAT35_24160 [Vitiosangium sp. GDMCC 1.1324]